MPAATPIQCDPLVLKAVALLQADGHSWREICRALRIGRTTYYRCLDEIERIKAEGLTPPESDDG